MLCCSLQDQFAGPRDEFSNEVDLLAKIDHRNLVRLLGFTDKGNERIIITEYVPNGTLREHLDGKLCFPYCFLTFRSI
jgi:serine/threonine protein kinase